MLYNERGSLHMGEVGWIDGSNKHRTFIQGAVIHVKPIDVFNLDDKLKQTVTVQQRGGPRCEDSVYFLSFYP